MEAIYVYPEVSDRLNQIADTLGCSVSELIEALIDKIEEQGSIEEVLEE